MGLAVFFLQLNDGRVIPVVNYTSQMISKIIW
jgi:hypothetical protein